MGIWKELSGGIDRINMREEELISVIVPVYQVQLYLNRCIESIIKQTYTRLEIILIDDGSVDSGAELCDEWALTDDRISVIHRNNMGLSEARNAGLAAATGDLIVFIDSDDYIEKEMLEKLYTSMKVSGADISICDFEYVKENGEKRDETIKERPIKNDTISGKEAIKRMRGKLNVYYVVAWNKLYKKELFKNVRFPKGKIHEDAFTTYRLFANSRAVTKINDKCYHYVLRSGSIMSERTSRKKMDEIEAWLNYDRYLASIGYRGLAAKVFEKDRIQYMETYYGAIEEDYNKEELKRLHRKYRETFRVCKDRNVKKLAKQWLIYVNPGIRS